MVGDGCGFLFLLVVVFVVAGAVCFVGWCVFVVL